MRSFFLVLLLIQDILCQCPPGYSQLFKNNQLITCNPQNICSCASIAAGYFCQFSTQSSQYICCGIQSNQCPSSSAQLATNGGGIQTCQSSANCAQGYFCNQNTCCASPSTQCTGETGGCPMGQVLMNGFCTNQVPIGSPCQTSLVCSGGAQCQNGFCQCANGVTPTNGQCSGNGQCVFGSVFVPQLNQCLSMVAPGVQCSQTSQCLDSSICNNGFCSCQGNTQVMNGFCIPFNGGPCQQGQVLINNICRTYSITGGSCVADAMCVGGSICQNSVCTCPANTQSLCVTSVNNLQSCFCISPNNNNNLLPIGSFGCTFVSATLQCAGNAQCAPNGQCLCPQGTSQQGAQCVTTGGGNCQNGQILGPNGQCLQLVSPGSQCSTTTTMCLDGVCIFNTCSCQNNAQLSNGYCVPINNGLCGTNQVSVNGQCLVVASPGNNCQTDQQCLGGSNCLNGVCSCTQTKQRFCTNQNGFQTCYCVSSSSNSSCQANQVLINGQCFNQVQIGGACAFTQQCMGNSQCSNGMCQCPNGAFPTNGQCSGGNNCQTGQILGPNGQCLQLVSPGSQCSATTMCLDGVCNFNTCSCQNNAQLSNGYCVPMNNGFCGTNQVSVNGQCLAVATPGNNCQTDQQCLGGSNCLNGICSCTQTKQRFCTNQNGFQTCYCVSSNSNSGCQTGQVLVNGQCLNQIQLGGSCSVSQQCVTLNAVCNFGVCQCPQGTNLQNNQCVNGSCGVNQVLINGQCFNQVQLGAFCSFSQQCIASNSVCQSNFCQCSQGFIQQGNQCVSNGNNNGCGVNQVLINGQCFNQAQFGSSCSFSQQCITSNAVCQNGFCQCPAGSNLQGSVCSTGTTPTSQVAPGGFCSLDFTQCLDSSTCYMNNCTCMNGGTALFGYCLPQKTDFCSQTQIQINGQCVTYSIVGGQCQGSDLQCLGGSKCINGVCSCRTGQPTCLANNQCYCPTLIQCRANQVLINGQCFNQVQLGAFCSFSQQCIASNSVCQSNSCQCSQGYIQQNNQCIANGNNYRCRSYQVLVGGSCLDTVSIGMQCTVFQQCPQNSLCSGGMCVCYSGLTYNGSVCISSPTFCPQGTVIVSNVCRPLVSLNQFCQSNQQCIAFGSCVNSFCQCANGSRLINNVCRTSSSSNPCNSNQVLIGNMCYNTVPLGSNCMFSQQCQGSGTCTNSICICPSGTSNYGDGVCRGASNDGNLCSAGETPQYSNNQLINCLISACPSASYCKYNSGVSKYVCCRPGSSMLTCANPAYSVVYRNGQPLNCLLSACPPNAICEYNNSSGQYVCCQTGGSTSSVCQGNYYTYSNGFPFVCTSDSACTSTTSNYRYCRLAPGQTFSVCCDRF